MPEQVLVAGVDTSTQSCKVRVTDALTGKTVRFGSAKHPDGTSIDPENWWAAFQEAAKQAGGLDDVSALAVGGQQHGMVLLDSRGNVIRKAQLWNDTRSAPQAESLTQQLGTSANNDAAELKDTGTQAWVKAIGTPLVASITITKVAWVKQNEPENAARVAAICLPHDWLSWRIAGFGPQETEEAGAQALSHLFTDRSDASGTGYFDPAGNTYRTDLLDLALGRHDVVLPQVLAPREAASVVADPAVAGKNVNGGCILAPGGGDNAMASFGLSMVAGDVSISLGTSGVAAAISENPVYDLSGALNGFADVTGHFVPLACTINASRILDAGCHALDVDYDELASIAFGAPAGAEGISLIPFFDGERTPNRPTDNARLMGLTLHNTTRANIARAFVEGLLCSQRDCLEALRDQGVPIKRLLLIGGGAKSPAVRKLAPSIWGMDIQVPATDEYVAIGAARQAAWVLPGADSAPEWPVEITETFHDEPNEAVYAQYAKWRA
ncbi:MAG: FGGY family carbohydrate kinase [Bifidobacteriaceae bacterium]|jgi:xylulokinase|nr:FGGY family carbohydrate kinase [Bifidobacteriaceae bacterium]MCI1914194.1 FGGY family carbohydrate kinase [Bifidobacteriaceae bacterium]